jgi:CRP-like cAMP-binding protein
MLARRHEYSPAEKEMMVRSHAFFSRLKRKRLFRGQTTNALAAESVGCSPATVRRVMKAYRAKEFGEEGVSGKRLYLGNGADSANFDRSNEI